MRLYYYHDTYGNFGDELNVPIFRRIAPGVLRRRGDHLLLGIGTLLNQELPAAAQYSVFGSGVGYGTAPKVDERWRIYFVRGRRSATALGISDSFALTDPALLVRELLDVVPSTRRRGVLFIPHHSSATALDWRSIAALAGVDYVEPSDDPITVSERIGRAAVVVTEAMHGAIIADALRTPWLPVVTGDHINTEKWRDWAETVGVEPVFERLAFRFKSPSHSLSRWLKLSVRRSYRLGRLSPFRFEDHGCSGTQEAGAEHVAEALREICDRARGEAILSDSDSQQLLLTSLRAQVRQLQSDLSSRP